MFIWSLINGRLLDFSLFRVLLQRKIMGFKQIKNALPIWKKSKNT